MHRVHEGPSQGANFVADLNKAVVGHGTKKMGIPLAQIMKATTSSSDT